MEIHKGICIKKRQGQNGERNSRANFAALLHKGTNPRTCYHTTTPSMTKRGALLATAAWLCMAEFSKGHI